MHITLDGKEDNKTLRAVRAALDVLIGEETVPVRGEVFRVPDVPEAEPAPLFINPNMADDLREKHGMLPDQFQEQESLPQAEPIVPPVPQAVPDADVEVDINGLPHDPRIHASTKSKTQDGAWKKKRGVQDSLVERVTAELMGTVPPSVVDAAAVVPPVPTAPPVPEPEQPAAATVTWAEALQKLLTAKAAGTVTQEQLDAKAIELGIDAGFAGVSQHPDLYQDYLVALGL